MSLRAEQAGQWGEQELLAAAGPVRRFVSARLRDRHAVDDVVQETLLRVLVARNRLDESSLLPYAVVTARNLVTEMGREHDRHRRHAHRVVDLREPDRPEDVVLRREEQAALAAALDGLPLADRRLLLAHEVDGQDTVSLAQAHGTTPGGVAARLARARARLRVGYVLGLRGVDLPTVRCRPVLLALSAGDRRRQRSLQAGRHLIGCPACAEASGPLLQRQRALAGLAPWVWAPALLEAARRRAHQRSVQAAATSAVGVAVVAAVLATGVGRSPAHRTAPTPQPAQAGASVTQPKPLPPLSVAGRAVDVDPDRSLTGYLGRPVRANHALVLSVPADEGFWIGTDFQHRLWVQLQTATESGQHIRAGQRVSFTGTMVANPPSFAASTGVSAAEGAARLTEQAAHVQVPAAAVTVTGR